MDKLIELCWAYNVGPAGTVDIINHVYKANFTQQDAKTAFEKCKIARAESLRVAKAKWLAEHPRKQ